MPFDYWRKSLLVAIKQNKPFNTKVSGHVAAILFEPFQKWIRNGPFKLYVFHKRKFPKLTSKMQVSIGN
jgi:hypothetical protein